MYTETTVPSFVSPSQAVEWAANWNCTFASEKEKGQSDQQAEERAFATANFNAGKSAQDAYAKLLKQSKDDEVERLTNLILTAVALDWFTLPAQIQPALQAAILSGISAGLLQVDVADPAEVKAQAIEFARTRATELVGMQYDAEGNLIEDEDAVWAISDLTRTKIQQIIADVFRENTEPEDIQASILAALQKESETGIFSQRRARFIADTEITRAQITGNYAAWSEGGVQKVKWITQLDERTCAACSINDQIVRDIGKPFPSGDLHPGLHPHCRCSLELVR